MATKSKKVDNKANKAKKAQAAEAEDEDDAPAWQLEVTRDDARGLLLALGLKSSAKGDDAKMLGKLASIDEADDDADPGKYKKLYKQIIEANANGVEIVFSDNGDDNGGDEEEAKPAKGKAAAKGKAKAGKKSGGNAGGVGRGPGVISEIEAILKKATKKSPVTKAGIVEQLAKKFKDRSADAMAKTVAVQVPGRISSEKGFTVNTVSTDDGKAYYAGK